ncbi:MAG: Ppx/GppA family phosphatase [Paracoccaceae bacterium]|nr:Ppx/GppA family phosphatase [Paracoccaceae bacterium]
MDDGSAPEVDDWAPFGRPLFDSPGARALTRVGVVDVGSNSVRLVVFDGAARSPAYFFNEKVMCGLGAGMADTGRLNPDGKARAMVALKRFALLAKGMGAAPLTAVATAAVREAEDGPAFREDVLRETGLRLWVIDGTEEARLSAQGVLLGWPGSYGLVCDIGGSSMELAELQDGEVGKCVTSPLGPLRLAGVKGGKSGRRKTVKAEIDGLRATMGEQSDRLFLVGGSWRAFARIDMERRGYPLAVLHEYRMSRKDVRATAALIATSDMEELRRATGISETRASLLPLAAPVLTTLLDTFKPHDIAVSSYGIREGMLYEQMPRDLRDRDPLIEACRFAEAKDARLPGFGRTLHNFIAPLFEGRGPDHYRLVRAACLLHDVTWRAHPDYRHEACFDLATRANMAGLAHRERVFLGLALLHRYKNSRSGTRFEPLFGLLSEKEAVAAEQLGKAMRFGAMFSGQDAERMGRLSWSSRRKCLSFHLADGTADLFGEVAQARFQALADSLGAKKTEIAHPS